MSVPAHHANATVNRTQAMAIAGKPVMPVKFFALLGVVIALVFANTLIRWMLSGDFKPAPVGTDVIPHLTLILVRNTEVFFGVVSPTGLFTANPWKLPVGSSVSRGV